MGSAILLKIIWRWYALVPSISILTGVLQYVLLRQYLPRMGWWVLVTVAGWFLGVLLIALPG